MDSNFSVTVQVIILFISILLFIIYFYKIFALEKHNRLALAFAIVTFLWFLTVFIRYLQDRPKKKEKIILAHVPYSIKCTVGDKNCEDGNIEIWGIFHFIIYILIGLFVPDCYIEIIIISILCEMIETSLNHTSKYIIDPLINISGYIIGSFFAKQYYKNLNSLTRCQVLC